MADYWKSIENYYCKFCKTYVKDTPFARKEHEQSDRHRCSMRRFVDKLVRNPNRTIGPSAAGSLAESAARSGPQSGNTTVLTENSVFSHTVKSQKKTARTVLDEEIHYERRATTGLEGLQTPPSAIGSEWELVTEASGLDGNYDAILMDDASKDSFDHKEIINAQDDRHLRTELVEAMAFSVKTKDISATKDDDWPGLTPGPKIKEETESKNSSDTHENQPKVVFKRRRPRKTATDNIDDEIG